MREALVVDGKATSWKIDDQRRIHHALISPLENLAAVQFCNDDGIAQYESLNLFSWSNDSPTVALFREMHIQNGFFSGFSFSPDGKKLALLAFSHDTNRLCDDPQEPELQIHNLADGTVENSFLVSPESPEIAWSLDGQSIYTAGRSLRSWDLAEQKLNWEFADQENIRSIAPSPDGKQLAFQGRKLTVVDSHAGVRVWDVDLMVACCGSHWTPDSKYLFTRGSVDLHCWEAGNGEFVREVPVGYNGRPKSCLCSKDGSTLIDFGREQELVCISSYSGKVVDRIGKSKDAPVASCLHDDSRLTIIDSDNCIHGWNLKLAADTTKPDPPAPDLFELPPLQVPIVDSPPHPPTLHTQSPVCDLSQVPVFRKLARPTVRLHPRRVDTPLPADVSKVGGADLIPDKRGGGIIWPADKPWPRCEEHGEPLLPILQLLASDFPDFPFPKTRDVFQLMWCPRDHESASWGPHSSVFWWNIGEVALPYAEPPVLLADGVQEEYVPFECALHGERVIEYPSLGEPDLLDSARETSSDLRKRIPHMQSYEALLSSAPGTKLGGYPSWVQDPNYPLCEVSGEPMEHLLTIASNECDGASFRRWLTLEERPIYDSDDWQAAQRIVNPTGLMLGDAGSIYVCHSRKASSDQIKTVFQCS